ncbi:MAG TPA: VWA domain-containing protein [Polyangiaceae bacterium]|nr:VWA domain-containing protein [Polyangiaceae bacterium]
MAQLLAVGSASACGSTVLHEHDEGSAGSKHTTTSHLIDAGLAATDAGDANGANGPSGGGTGGGSSQSDSGLPSATEPSCAAVHSAAKRADANFLFVIDQSGSMDDPAPGDALGRTKWEATRQALGDALDVLAMQTNAKVGLSLFPVRDPILQCSIQQTPDVPVAKLSAAQRVLLDGALDAVAPRGDTPIGGTMMYSYEFLRQQIVEQHTLSGNTFVVLFTDGQETCDQAAAQSLVDKNTHLATEFNIRTFVIGAPGSEGERARLSQIAFEGGTAVAPDCNHDPSTHTGDCHFDMTEKDDFAAALGMALDDISNDRSVRCDFQVPSQGDIDLGKVNITYTNSQSGEVITVPQNASGPCDQVDGWQYNDDLTRIRLCGQSCDQVLADPDGSVSILLGCKTKRIF